MVSANVLFRGRYGWVGLEGSKDDRQYLLTILKALLETQSEARKKSEQRRCSASRDEDHIQPIARKLGYHEEELMAYISPCIFFGSEGQWRGCEGRSGVARALDCENDPGRVRPSTEPSPAS